MERFFDVAWIVPIPPFLAFLAIVLFLHNNKHASWLTAVGGASISLILGWSIAFAAFFKENFGANPHEDKLFTIPTGSSEIMIGYQVDPSNAMMLFMVTFLLVMIFIYSGGYKTFPGHLRPEMYPVSYKQNKDPRYSRFMAYISLFAVGMLGLVVSNSLITFFMFWEVMGLCSYLLIGFWYEKKSATAANIKAFMTTRVGDAIMLTGMLLLYSFSESRSLMFHDIFSPENLESVAHLTWNIFGVPFNALGVISVLIFFGTVGKSAQFPLHVWLPDAMEGPTPVSAMIHAATMVSAGVYLLVRMFPLYSHAMEVAPASMHFVAFIGAFTALFASTIAVAQWDIKRVLAYSTISQLGYMVAAIGIGAYGAALFHLITHAFFKALLFLGSGSVIHGVEHGHHISSGHGHGDGGHGGGHDDHGHAPAKKLIGRIDGDLDPEDPQDMRNMGGLLNRMPRTAVTFIIGGAALSGFPFVTAGFWSKDEILASAWNGHSLVFWTLFLSALLTAFYTTRQICLTFFGQPRTEMAVHAPENEGRITWPLILISPFALVLGFIGLPWSGWNWLAGFLNPFLEYQHVHVHEHTFSFTPMLLSIVAALGGILLGLKVYYQKPLEAGQIDPVRNALGPIWWLWHRKYFVDEFYQGTIISFSLLLSNVLYWIDDFWVIDPIVNGIGRLGVWISKVLAEFDRLVIDGFVNLVAWFTNRMGAVLRNTQDGQVQVYMLVAVVTITVWLLLKAMPIIFTLV